MSLIRVRQRRKKEWIDAKKGKSPKTLALLFVGVVIVIWYLGTSF